jgi:hypothetical protein
MLFGFVVIPALNYRRLTGATLIGILIVMALGVRFGLTKFSGTVSLPPSIAPTLFKLDFSRLFDLTFVIVIFSILFLDLFGNVGTLIRRHASHRPDPERTARLDEGGADLGFFRRDVRLAYRNVDEDELHRERRGRCRRGDAVMG